MKLTTLPVRATPRASAPTPWTKTSEVIPRPAARDRTYPSAALMGTMIERNTMINKTMERPTTKMPNGRIDALSRSETSACTAVIPVTRKSETG